MSTGLTAITAKLTSKHAIANPWLFNFLINFVVLLFTIPPAIIFHAGLPNDWLAVILAAVFSALFLIFWIFSNYVLDVSVLTPLFNFRGVFAVLIGAAFLNEKLTVNQLFFIALIFIGGMFTSLDERFDPKSFFKKSIMVGLFAMFILALSGAFVKISLMKNSLWTNNLWIAVIDALLFVPTLPLFVKDLKKIRSAQAAPVGIMGILMTITDFAGNIAYGVNLGITSLIVNTPFSMIIAFLFSIFAPKLLEKHTNKVYAVRFIAAAVMIFAAMQLTG